MRGKERIAAISSSSPRLKAQLPGLPVDTIALMRTLRAANQALSTYLDAMMRPLGVPESQMHTLLVLFTSESGASTPRALCDQVGQTPANMTRILLALSQLGYLSRKVDTLDARRQQVRITARGRAFVHDIVPRISEPLKRAARGFSVSEISQASGLLTRLTAALDDGERALRSNSASGEVRRRPSSSKSKD